MPRSGFVFAAIIVSLAIADSAGAGDFWARAKLDFMRMNCWPEPFAFADRELVRSPLVAMTSRGWQLQNTLSDHFFRTQDQSLTQAGEFKLKWILTQAPAHRRTVYVLRSTEPATTAQRIEAVERFAGRVTSGQDRTEVLVSDMAPAGGSGDYFDQVDRQLKASVPAPRLPERSITGFTSGG